MSRETFPFEGEQLTLAEICKRVPAMSRDTVKKYLRLGHTTRQSMLSVDPHAKARSSGSKGARTAGQNRFGRQPYGKQGN